MAMGGWSSVEVVVAADLRGTDHLVV